MLAQCALRAWAAHAAAPGGLLGGSSSGAARAVHGHASGGLHDVWPEVLRVAKSNPEKLRDIVDTLTTHCVRTQSGPPLDSYNELLRICDAHGDVCSISKLWHMACSSGMHIDLRVFERLASVYACLPKPAQPGPSAAALAGGGGRFQGLDGLGPRGSFPGGAAAGAGAGATPSSSGAIREAPPCGGEPDASTTGGASSVSAGGAFAPAPPLARHGAPGAPAWHAPAVPSAGAGLGRAAGRASASASAGAAAPTGVRRPAPPAAFVSFGRYGSGGHGGRMRD